MAAVSNLQVTIRRHSSHQSLLRPTFLSTIARAVLVKTCCNLCRVLARSNERKRGKYIIIILYNYYSKTIRAVGHLQAIGAPVHVSVGIQKPLSPLGSRNVVKHVAYSLSRHIAKLTDINREHFNRNLAPRNSVYTEHKLYRYKEYNRFLLVSRHVVSRISCKNEG